MTKRIETICSLVKKCESFADVGCDHGFVAKSVLDKKLAASVCITDISKPSLNKAIELLSNFYPENFSAYLCDGLTLVPYCEQVLIAGMGGEEIIKILQKSPYKPDILILQPMKNADKLRRYLHFSGYGIERDFMFFADKKYYEIMRARLDYDDFYTEDEETYGRENLKGNSDFSVYLDNRIAQTEKLISGKTLSDKSRDALMDKLKELRGIKDEIKRNLRTD